LLRHNMGVFRIQESEFRMLLKEMTKFITNLVGVSYSG
jgi:hypothetical protein